MIWPSEHRKCPRGVYNHTCRFKQIGEKVTLLLLLVQRKGGGINSVFKPVGKKKSARGRYCRKVKRSGFPTMLLAKETRNR